MQKLVSFTNITIDGYFADANSDMKWAHNEMQDPEWDAFVADNAKGGNKLLLGRITYELMKSYWPTPAAKQTAPLVAERMNNLPKVVFSRTLDKADWSNTTLVKSGIEDAVKKIKLESGSHLTILGSGSIVAQLADAGLIDEYQIITHPIILGSGKTLFAGMKHNRKLKRTRTRNFNNGNSLAFYEPM